MVENVYLKVLEKIADCLNASPIPWVVTGSLGMALHGVPIKVRDIDIQTDEKGAYEIERRLAQYVVKPVTFSESKRIRSNLARWR